MLITQINKGLHGLGDKDKLYQYEGCGGVHCEMTILLLPVKLINNFNFLHLEHQGCMVDAAVSFKDHSRDLYFLTNFSHHVVVDIYRSG